MSSMYRSCLNYSSVMHGGALSTQSLNLYKLTHTFVNTALGVFNTKKKTVCMYGNEQLLYVTLSIRIKGEIRDATK